MILIFDLSSKESILTVNSVYSSSSSSTGAAAPPYAPGAPGIAIGMAMGAAAIGVTPTKGVLAA